jgi:Mn-dependent DtxR family transcriptional regulator
MTTAATLFALHPDTNGGDASRVEQLQSALAARRLAKRLERCCACGCGKLVPLKSKYRERIKPNLYFSMSHYLQHKGAKIRNLAKKKLS